MAKYPSPGRAWVVEKFMDGRWLPWFFHDRPASARERLRQYRKHWPDTFRLRVYVRSRRPA